MLVRPDGSIVFSRRAYDPKTRFFAAELLRQRLEERQQLKQEPGPLTFTAAGVDEGSTRLVAVAPGQLARSYPNLTWLVALSVERDEITAPFRSLVWYLVIVFALTAIAVLGIALWLSLRLAAPGFDPPWTCTVSMRRISTMRRTHDDQGSWRPLLHVQRVELLHHDVSGRRRCR